MKLRICVVLFVASIALGAGPPPGLPQTAPPQTAPPVKPQSAWSKFKSGARRLVPGAGDAQSGATPPRYDDQVRPATAVTPQPQTSRRRPFFKSARPQRTLSEYMAWEKP